MNHPTVEQLTAIAANCFAAQDLLRMERVLLDALDFGVAGATAFSFLHLYAQGLPGVQPGVAALAVYLLVSRRAALRGAAPERGPLARAKGPGGSAHGMRLRARC